MKTLWKLSFIVLLNAAILIPASGEDYLVGSDHTYTTPNALYLSGILVDGDTISIAAETYVGTAALAVWNVDHLLIRGVGGRPILDADGAYIQGKGIWVLAGDNITVENIEFTGAAVPDLNGAGIRLDGSGLAVRFCYFHDNENGILATSGTPGDILIEYSEFAYNGAGDGQSHNIYINNTNTFTFQYNYSHHAFIGHCVKTRAAENHILYNRIMDEDNGRSSRLIDISNGGKTLIMGNVLMQGPAAENNNLIGYGLEGLTNPEPLLYVVNNTLVNERQASCRFLHIQAGSTTTVANSLFVGTGTLVDGEVDRWVNAQIIEDPTAAQLTDVATYDYHLLAASPAVDAGFPIADENGLQLTPTQNYEHPTMSMDRIQAGEQIDVGAYELLLPNNTDQAYVALLAYPNPTSSYLHIGGQEDCHYKVYGLDGMSFLLEGQVKSGRVDVSTLTPGTYVLVVAGKAVRFLKI